jgi:hypothetical protein
MVRTICFLAAIGLLSASLSGCGRMATDRGVTGGAVGAGAAVPPEIPPPGAIGGEAGAAPGVRTDPADADLDAPAWR